MKLDTGRVTAKKTARAPLHENNHVRKTTAPAIAPIPKTGSQIRSKIGRINDVFNYTLRHPLRVPIVSHPRRISQPFFTLPEIKTFGSTARSSCPRRGRLFCLRHTLAADPRRVAPPCEKRLTWDARTSPQGALAGSKPQGGTLPGGAKSQPVLKAGALLARQANLPI